MRHVREEPRLQLVGAAQVVRLLVELRIERDDAAIGVFELAIEARRAPAASAAVRRARAAVPGSAAGFLRPVLWGRRCRTASAISSARRLLIDPAAAAAAISRATIRVPADVESIDRAVHQPAGTDDPEAHSGRRPVTAGQNRIELRDAGTPILDDGRAAAAGGRRDRPRTGPRPRWRTGTRCGRFSETAVAIRVCSARRTRAGRRYAPRFASQRQRLRRGRERVTLVDACWGTLGVRSQPHSPSYSGVQSWTTAAQP